MESSRTHTFGKQETLAYEILAIAECLFSVSIGCNDTYPYLASVVLESDHNVLSRPHNLMNIQRILAALAVLFFSGLRHAEGADIGAVDRLPTREGVIVPIYAFWRADAVATVVLFSGGAGGYGQIGADGWPSGGNFLIRTGKHWATYPFNLVMVGRPKDGIDLSMGPVRTGEQHAADNVAIFKAIKLKSPLPIWVVGTSMGTISAAAAAIQDNDKLISGVVLTSSIVAYKIRGLANAKAREDPGTSADSSPCGRCLLGMPAL